MESPDCKLLMRMADAGYRLRLSAVIEAIDADQAFTGDFLSGSQLVTALEDLYRGIVGPVNEARRGRLDELRKQPVDTVDRHSVVAAIIDPLVVALGGPDGALVRFAFSTIALQVAAVPQEIWWTPSLRKLLAHVAGDRAEPARWVPSMVNKTLYIYLAEADWLRHPAQEEDLARFRFETTKMVHALLRSVWD